MRTKLILYIYFLFSLRYLRTGSMIVFDALRHIKKGGESGKMLDLFSLNTNRYFEFIAISSTVLYCTTVAVN